MVFVRLSTRLAQWPGPLTAIFLMLKFRSDFRKVFWAATLPAFVLVTLLGAFVREPSRVSPSAENRPRLHWKELKYFSRAFWFVVTIGGVFTLARFSEAFLLLRARSLGLGDDYVPIVLV